MMALLWSQVKQNEMMFTRTADNLLLSFFSWTLFHRQLVKYSQSTKHSNTPARQIKHVGVSISSFIHLLKTVSKS